MTKKSMVRFVVLFSIGLAALALLVVLGACATIFSGSTQKIAVSVQPTDATVQVFDQNNMPVWNSSGSAAVTLQRGAGYFQGASYRIEVSKAGYEKKTVSVSAGLNAGWYLLGNILVGGLIGWLVVDPLSGGMWTLSPDAVHTNLETARGAGILPEGYLPGPSRDVGAGDDGGAQDVRLVIVLRQAIADAVFETLGPERVN